MAFSFKNKQGKEDIHVKLKVLFLSRVFVTLIFQESDLQLRLQNESELHLWINVLAHGFVHISGGFLMILVI